MNFDWETFWWTSCAQEVYVRLLWAKVSTAIEHEPFGMYYANGKTNLGLCVRPLNIHSMFGKNRLKGETTSGSEGVQLVLNTKNADTDADTDTNPERKQATDTEKCVHKQDTKTYKHTYKHAHAHQHTQGHTHMTWTHTHTHGNALSMRRSHCGGLSLI